MTPRWDAVVAGGGLAGSMAALELARAGRDVVLLEKTREPHDKVCGDFLSGETLQHFERQDLRPESLGSVPIQTMRLVTPWFSRECALPFTAWSLTRRTLDETLLQRTSAAGVQVERGAVADAVNCVQGTWFVRLRDDRSFHATNAILATGKLDVRGWPRPQGKQSDLVAFKMYYRLAEREHNQLGNAVELILFRGGYAGLQPVENGLVNLCFLIRKDQLRSQERNWSGALRHILQHAPHLQDRLLGASPMLEKPLAAFHIPYGHLQRDSQGGLWRVGDQAAVIPSFCGDGMAIAVHSGALAASCLLRGLPSHAYQQELHRQLKSRIRVSTVLSRLLVAFPTVSYLAKAFPSLLEMIAAYTRIPGPRTCRGESISTRD